jgi:hypothetical protein
MLLRYVYHKTFTDKFANNVNGRMGSIQTKKGVWSGTQMGQRLIKALVLGCTDGA